MSQPVEMLDFLTYDTRNNPTLVNKLLALLRDKNSGLEIPDGIDIQSIVKVLDGVWVTTTQRLLGTDQSACACACAMLGATSPYILSMLQQDKDGNYTAKPGANISAEDYTCYLGIAAIKNMEHDIEIMCPALHALWKKTGIFAESVDTLMADAVFRAKYDALNEHLKANQQLQPPTNYAEIERLIENVPARKSVSASDSNANSAKNAEPESKDASPAKTSADFQTGIKILILKLQQEKQLGLKTLFSGGACSKCWGNYSQQEVERKSGTSFYHDFKTGSFFSHRNKEDNIKILGAAEDLLLQGLQGVDLKEAIKPHLFQCPKAGTNFMGNISSDSRTFNLLAEILGMDRKDFDAFVTEVRKPDLDADDIDDDTLSVGSSGMQRVL